MQVLAHTYTHQAHGKPTQKRQSAQTLGNVVVQVSTNGPNLAIHEPWAPGA